MKICSKCGNENSDEVNFCENCGTKLTISQKKCPKCQTINPNDSRFCENCGYDFNKPISKVTPSQKPAKDKKQVSGEKVVANQAEKKSVDEHPQSKQVEETRSVSVNEKPQTRVQANKPVQQTEQITKNPNSKWQWIASVVILVLIVGIGAYFLFGRSNTATEPATATSHSTTQASSSAKVAETSSSSAVTHRSAKAVNFNKSQIKNDVETTLGSIGGTNSVYVSPVNSNQSVLINNGTQSSASSIKIFILVTAYTMAKEGIFNLNDMHTVTDDEKVGGTGVIQNMSEGTKLSYREILEDMIEESDNTAANIVIDKLGGFDLINNKIKSMGAMNTKLRRKMMDTEAIDENRDNTTSARDMGITLKKIYNHQMVSKSSDTEMLSILEKNKNRTKLPKLLPSTVTVYNKTGEFSDYGVQNDAEIVEGPHGAFVAVALSENGTESDQVSAMNRLGLKLYQNILE